MPSPELRTAARRAPERRIPEVWRTTTFRLSVLYGAVFAAGVVLLLGLVYWRAASTLTQRVDTIVAGEAAALARTDAAGLPRAVERQVRSAAGRLNAYGLFSRDGAFIAGDITRLPTPLTVGEPFDALAGAGMPFGARVLALRLPWGEVLVVGRDLGQLRELRSLVTQALVWSGVLIAVLGLASGTALSLGPLRRLQALQGVSHRIMAGDLGARMPIAGRGDELDLFAAMTNAMIGEVERLLGEAKGANDAVAHNLRTPLTRVRALLARARHEDDDGDWRATLEQAELELELTLERFRALLRISEIEARARSVGFRLVELGAVAGQAVELYEPLAEERAVRLGLSAEAGAVVQGDEKLLFEALSALIDNAIKFSPEGGTVQIGVRARAHGEVEIAVGDRGPGVAPAERQAVLQRFYRSASTGEVPGSGLGLSIVAAIARLHRLDLRLEDNAPGLRAVLSGPVKA